MREKRFVKKYLNIGLLMCVLAVSVQNVAVCSEEGIDSIYTDEIFMQIGELETLKVHSLTRLSLTKPGIADIINADDKEILLIAKSVGETILFIWDEHGKRTVTIHVLSEDLDMVAERIEDLLKEAKLYNLQLKKHPREKRIVVTGKLIEKQNDLLTEITSPFASNILSLVEVLEPEDLIQIDIQVTELNETLSKSLGIAWSSDGSTQGISLGYQEALPTSDGSIGDLFKIGDFSRTTQLLAAVNASIQEGKGRILSKPRIVVNSGEEASFLVGGEIPIRTITTTTGGASQENITFKDYGISMTVKPEIERHNKVNIGLQVEVSDIDQANQVGDDVAFVTRTTETQLLLDDKQTIVLAGLIRKQEGEQISRVPFLGSVPIVGALFRSRATPSPNQDTELVITVTPTILSDYDEVRSVQTTPENGKSSSSMSGQHKIVSPMHVPVPNSIPPEMMSYIQSVQQKISYSITYPEEAENFGWEGTVKLALHILNDGTLAFALIKESSGYSLFDENALTIAKSIAPYAQFPSGSQLQELNVTIPIVYSLQKN